MMPAARRRARSLPRSRRRAGSSAVSVATPPRPTAPFPGLPAAAGSRASDVADPRCRRRRPGAGTLPLPVSRRRRGRRRSRAGQTAPRPSTRVARSRGSGAACSEGAGPRQRARRGARRRRDARAHEPARRRPRAGAPRRPGPGCARASAGAGPSRRRGAGTCAVPSASHAAPNAPAFRAAWTLWHHGLPPDLSAARRPADRPLRRSSPPRACARASAAPANGRRSSRRSTRSATPAWAASRWPARSRRRTGALGGAGETSRVSGYVVKRRLVRATLAAIEAMRAVEPRCRFLHVEPIIHVVAPRQRPDLAPLAQQIRHWQWQSWDMLAGLAAPELGGHAAALDLVGVNHYAASQWEADTEERLHWHLRDPRRRRLSALLAEASAALRPPARRRRDRSCRRGPRRLVGRHGRRGAPRARGRRAGAGAVPVSAGRSAGLGRARTLAPQRPLACSDGARGRARRRPGLRRTAGRLAAGVAGAGINRAAAPARLRAAAVGTGAAAHARDRRAPCRALARRLRRAGPGAGGRRDRAAAGGRPAWPGPDRPARAAACGGRRRREPTHGHRPAARLVGGRGPAAAAGLGRRRRRAAAGARARTRRAGRRRGLCAGGFDGARRRPRRQGARSARRPGTRMGAGRRRRSPPLRAPARLRPGSGGGEGAAGIGCPRHASSAAARWTRTARASSPRWRPCARICRSSSPERSIGRSRRGRTCTCWVRNRSGCCRNCSRRRRWRWRPPRFPPPHRRRRSGRPGPRGAGRRARPLRRGRSLRAASRSRRRAGPSSRRRRCRLCRRMRRRADRKRRRAAAMATRAACPARGRGVGAADRRAGMPFARTGAPTCLAADAPRPPRGVPAAPTRIATFGSASPVSRRDGRRAASSAAVSATKSAHAQRARPCARVSGAGAR
ncbi:MAG: hypothetical protein MZW92_48350 [Comamonadaceae bacterium]|nr:hypothetical protein [Comamonadaceae bacterium]